MTNQPPNNDMRERILQGALEVFSNTGYSSSTIKDISMHVGCNAITIFRHFEDKENLFVSVVERFYRLEGFDADYIKARLSYTNVHADLTLMANMFFEILYKNLHILRVFIHDGPFFESIAKYTWYLPKPLQNFVAEYITTVYPTAISQNDTLLIAEMFSAYITRTCLRSSVHDDIQEYTPELAKSTEKILNDSIDMIMDVIMRSVKNQPQQPQDQPEA